VEAKRAVPRSEMAKESSGPSMLGIKPSTPSTPAKVSTTPGNQTPITSSPSLSSQSYDSRGALDPRINMDEYAYNKVFVGGLHYDTRDGKRFHCKATVSLTNILYKQPTFVCILKNMEKF
jgi:hypothetical protein